MNLLSNCIGCVIVEHYSHDELQSLNDVTQSRHDADAAVADDKNTVAIDIPDEVEETKESGDDKNDIALGASILNNLSDYNNTVAIDTSDEVEETIKETKESEEDIAIGA